MVSPDQQVHNYKQGLVEHNRLLLMVTRHLNYSSSFNNSSLTDFQSHAELILSYILQRKVKTEINYMNYVIK